MAPKLPTTPVLRTKKRRIGSGEVAAEDLPLIENAFNNILETINSISTGKLEDVEDLLKIKSGVKQALDTVTNIKKWIKENPCSDVKAISFSKFDYNLLENRLGVTVKEINPSLTLDQFGEQLTEGLLRCENVRLLDGMIEAVEGRDFCSLHRLLSLVESGVHTHPEASGRMLIDQWLLESMDISSNIKSEGDMEPGGYYRSFLFPEFQLSSLTDNPSKIIFNHCITYITGSTDYALWSVPSQDISEEHNDVLSGKFNFALITPAGTFTFFEAKRDAEDLDDHVPQAVAQCLAMCEKGGFSEMVFCLTTGKSWLFGIVDTALLTSKVCWKTSKFHIAAAPEFKTIKSLIKLILLWTLQPPKILKNAIQAI